MIQLDNFEMYAQSGEDKYPDTPAYARSVCHSS